uniref:Uncharacterized protein LOC111104343 n=1 Tax=Crassostrea virginica TaxID=6565 RepID=A0A8B8AS90_CRAVI|nr:uncharacterized protein LOC111104343 [Crassostrea virginica]
MSRTGKQLVRSSSALDTEYNALRRRMSRLRVQQGQLPVADDMDLEPNDEYYNDLLKFWRKHKIYMGKEMMATIADAQAKKKAKQRGRRKSHEFEDLDLNKKSGKLTPAIEETEEENLLEEESVESSPEGTPKVKKKSVTEQPKINGKVAHSGNAHTRESSAKSIIKVPTKTGLSNGKLSAKSVIHRKISDPVKPKK